jgi:alkylhydroperoxidase family enzyme
MRLELGGLAALLDALGHAPESLAAVLALLEATLLGGKIPRTTKELVALAALAQAGVDPWRATLRDSLLRRAVAPAVVEDVETLGETTRLPERTRRVVAFGRRAALQPAMLGEPDFVKLRREGVTDAELAELLALAGALALLITLSRALG